LSVVRPARRAEPVGVPIAFYAPFKAGPPSDLIVQIDKRVGFAVAIIDELMKLTGAQSVTREKR
jgi:hypothetical protein